MAAIVSAVPRLIGRVFARLTAPKRTRRAAIPGRTIARI